jgi:hypothetical protein
MGAMLDTRETLPTFPNLGQQMFPASEQTRTNQKKEARRDQAKAFLGRRLRSARALPEKLEREVSRCCNGKHAKQRG